jgi:hypothetical protein
VFVLDGRIPLDNGEVERKPPGKYVVAA